MQLFSCWYFLVHYISIGHLWEQAGRHGSLLYRQRISSFTLSLLDCIVLHDLFGAAWISKVLREDELVSG